MGALFARLTNWWPTVALQDKPLAEPESLCQPRPMKGFFRTLTPEQQAKALAYRGEENHGDPEFTQACLSR
jgi:hypothetical protein